MSIDTVLLLALLNRVHAAPPPSRVHYARQSTTTSVPSPSPSTTSSGLTVQVWAPLVAIAAIILVMIIFSCVKRQRASTALAAQVAAAHQQRLTADQLAGVGPGARGGTTTTGAASRPRRTRRTPSQISTRSLPAYMKDPGDSEMVLARAIHDMEDPMPRLSEDRDRENSGSGLLSVSQAELGGSNGVSAVDLSLGFNNSTTSYTPLLTNDADSRDQGRTHRHTEESSQGRGQSPSQGSPQQQQQQHQHRRSHSGSRSGLGGAQSSSLLRRVSTRSIQGQQQPDGAHGHITRPSIDTVQTMGGSGSEDSQHALLDVGWGLGAIYGRGGEDGEAGGEAGGDGGGSGSAAGSGSGVYGNMGANEGFALSAEELQARGDAPSYSEAVAATGTPGDMEMTAIRTAGGRDVDSGAGGDPSTTTTTAQRRRSGFRSFAARLSQFMPSGTSTGVTPPVPAPAIPLNSPPPSSSSASPIQDHDTIRSASPAAATTTTSTRHHTRHRTTASGSISTVSTVPATSVSLSTPPSALLASSHSRTHARSTSTLASRPDTPGAGTGTGLRAASPNPASASTTSLLSALASRSRSRIALGSIFSSNANGSHTTLPRPGSSQSNNNNNNLAAASTTSLTLSISPPLPHTVTRTAFVYPSAGPTTEQMKFISSVENVSRFAVPYGRAAEEAVPGPGGEGEEEPPPFEWGDEGARGEEDEGEGQGEGEGERREEGEDEGGHAVNASASANATASSSTSTSRLAPSSSSDSNPSTGAGAGGVANGNGVPFVSWIV